jgi:hypothetical protein
MFVRNVGIIIIIIIGKTALFEPQPSLEDSATLHPGFELFGFRDSIFYIKQGPQSCVQPPTWRTRSLYLCPPVRGWPSYTPQAPGSVVVAFYDSQR